MGLGSYILYLRAIKDGITPREVAAEIGMPEHYIHAIELEKHAGNGESRGKLSEYFDVPVDDFNDFARSTHARFMEMLKKERRPQMGFLLMSGETLMGTVDGADTSIVKIVELNTGTKTILQRHAIKKWWPLKARASREEGAGGGERRFTPNGGGRRPPMRPGGGPGGGRGDNRDRRPMPGRSGPPRPRVNPFVDHPAGGGQGGNERDPNVRRPNPNPNYRD
jgi:hypothetical protein